MRSQSPIDPGEEQDNSSPEERSGNTAPTGSSPSNDSGGDSDQGTASPPSSTAGHARFGTSPLGRAMDQLQAELKRTEERLLRRSADLENFKRRSRRELQDSVQRAEEGVVQEFLPIIDNLERAIAHGSNREDTDDSSKPADDSGLLQGVEMVLRQFVDLLGRYDIKGFPSVGAPFDPEFHEAIQQAPSELPRNTVLHEVQKGYRRGDRLVRPAMVVVSRGPEEGQPSNESCATGETAGDMEPQKIG